MLANPTSPTGHGQRHRRRATQWLDDIPIPIGRHRLPPSMSEPTSSPASSTPLHPRPAEPTPLTTTDRSTPHDSPHGQNEFEMYGTPWESPKTPPRQPQTHGKIERFTKPFNAADHTTANQSTSRLATHANLRAIYNTQRATGPYRQHYTNSLHSQCHKGHPPKSNPPNAPIPPRHRRELRQTHRATPTRSTTSNFTAPPNAARYQILILVHHHTVKR